MEKAIKNKVAKAVVPAVDVMFQALRCIENCPAALSIINCWCFEVLLHLSK